jgi:hypothetical protein
MGKLFLTYNNSDIQDGYFAQLQRVFAIRAIAEKFHFSYLHSEIIDIVPTQLDTFQSEREIENFLHHANRKYSYLSDPCGDGFEKIIEISAPTLKQLVLLKAKSVLAKRSWLVRITIPYRIIEKSPDMYKYATNLIDTKSTNFSFCEELIVVHARRGIAVQHILPGEKNVRILDDTYFMETIKKITNRASSASKLNLIILTDAPENDTYYKPLHKDENAWQQFDKFRTEQGILIQGHKFQSIVENFEGTSSIVRGGDLNRAIDVIRMAGHFIMSRSSMSYVGALLKNEGNVYYPPNFWHKPLRNWIKIEG